MRKHSGLFRRAFPVDLADIAVVLAGMGVLVLGTSLASAQKKGADKIRQSTYAAIAEVPEKAREKRNPVEGDAQAVAVGRKLFEQHCAECHGKDARGTRKGPTLLREEVQQATPGALFWILTNGVVRRGMPVWSKLPEQQRWQLVTFVHSLNATLETDRP